MAAEPIQMVNSGIFPGAQNFVVIGGQFTETNYILPASSETVLPPLPPLKHSSTFFTGQDMYLEMLKNHFSSHMGHERKSFLLHGLGGIGKTQICLKFIEQWHDLFSDIFWIDASSEATIELRLMQIAHANNTPQEIKQSAGSVLRWISQGSNWLMVYDGADGDYPVVEKYLPPGNGGNILITSRHDRLKRITLDKNSVKVVDMTDEDAASLILKSAMLDVTSGDINNSAKKLVTELGGVPIALDQAGAYIQSSCCGIDDYLQLYKKNKHQLMSDTGFKGASGYETSTYGTWDISMKEIKGMAENGVGHEALAAKSAIKLLRIFAFFNHENIPEELFQNAAENYMKRNVEEEAESGFPLSVKILDHETLFLNEEGDWEKIQFLGGIRVLLSFSFIRALDHLYSMHLLVNSWSRNTISKQDAIDHYLRARALISCSVTLDNVIDNYAFCRLLAPHIKSTFLHASELGLSKNYYDDEHTRFVRVFDRVGDWDEKEKLLLVAAGQRKARHGSRHTDTLTTMNDLASTYRRQGKWHEAEKIHVDVIKARKANLKSLF